MIFQNVAELSLNNVLKINDVAILYIRNRKAKETKDKTGQYIWTYSDWEFVDDLYGNMIYDYDF